MKIESLTLEHLRKPFSTSEKETTNFWFKRAYDEQEKWRCGSTKVLVDGEDILGYYTLAMQTISLKYGAAGYPTDRRVTAILIGQLAVNKDHEGKGYSRILFKSSIREIIEVAKHVGVYVIVVDPINESLLGYWEKYGFKRFSNTSLRMLYPMATLFP
ncbi:GNAT family N-acetyltransferase [Marispirochaeta aestuarii]|uniref:GNAT family N-acetyltransferase n=1 Tax=Marispirochaeta aestuarii TaxID=1963862 RepID=UPI0029C6E74E|nr:GNAT family N-acetyltransferase [Marispirochaeta aestuarii]